MTELVDAERWYDVDIALLLVVVVVVAVPKDVAAEEDGRLCSVRRKSNP